jgi:hypothetical protein
VKQLSDDRVCWGIYRIITRDGYDGMNTTYQKKFHYILIKYVSCNCPLVKSYVSNSHKSIIKQHVPIAMELEVSNRSDISAERFQQLLKHYRVANDMTYFQFTFWNLDASSTKSGKSTIASSSTSDFERDAVDDEDEDFFPSDGYFP